MSSVNKVDMAVALYSDGGSIPSVSEITGIPRSTVRYHLRKRGVIRSRTEGIHEAARQGRLGSGFRGRNRIFTDEHCSNIAKARTGFYGKNEAAGKSAKASGYIVYTTGEHKGRPVHCVAMETRIGRRLLPDECVHHIDGDRSNNNENNLALMTISAHARLHRREDALCGKKRERKQNGEFS